MTMLATLLSCFLLLDDAKSEEGKELERLQGVWNLVKVEMRGFDSPLNMIASPERRFLTVSGTEASFYTYAGPLRLEPAKQHLDWTCTAGRFKGEKAVGLYELTGDRLSILLPNPVAKKKERPSGFGPTTNTDDILFVFERGAAITRAEAAKRVQEAKTALDKRESDWQEQRANRDPLQQILRRLDAIEKRLDAIERRLAEKK